MECPPAARYLAPPAELPLYFLLLPLLRLPALCVLHGPFYFFWVKKHPVELLFNGVLLHYRNLYSHSIVAGGLLVMS